MKRITKRLCTLSLFFFIFTFLTVSHLGAAETRNIQFYTTPPGSVGHALIWGFCDMLSKHSTWLRGTVEVAWGTDTYKLLQRDPVRKKTGIGYLVPGNAWEADTVLKIKEVKMLPIIKVMTTNEFWVTYDASIKSMKDFSGKKVSIGKAGTVLAVGPEYLLKELGIFDKVKLQYLEFNDSKTALQDRTVDAAFQAVMLGKDAAVPVPTAMEIVVSGKPFFCIGVDQALVDAMVKKTGFPMTTIVMPKESMGKNQPEPVLTIEFPNCFTACPELDPEIAHEIARVMYEHVDELGKYHKAGALLKREDLSNVTFASDSLHPGAVKFFEEKGIKVGR